MKLLELCITDLIKERYIEKIVNFIISAEYKNNTGREYHNSIIIHKLNKNVLCQKDNNTIQNKTVSTIF